MEHIRESLKRGHSGYTRGCRCTACVEGRREYIRNAMRKHREKTKSPVDRRIKIRPSLERFGVHVSDAYIAGFFDGEGCVGIYHGKRGGIVVTTLYVGVSNTNPLPILAIQKRFGGRIYQRTPKKTAISKNMPLTTPETIAREFDFVNRIAGLKRQDFGAIVSGILDPIADT